ncbi:universal stress protein [Pirellulales bacterium]|nr:universal stress protein [Pirellulales bacterium]
MKALCAIDGSAGSDEAIRQLGHLLSPERDSIVFYYAPPEIQVHGASRPDRAVVELASEALAEKVFDRSRNLLPSKLAERVTAATGQQKPRHGIPAAAKVHRPDLIAVGARGASRFGLPRLGSVSRSVVHSSEVPVLVARARRRPETDPLHLLLCCARTESGGAAGAFISQLAIPEAAAGHVLHVGESPFGDGIPEWLEAEARVTESEPAAQEYVAAHDDKLNRWREELTKYCGELPPVFHAHRPVIREGHPGEQIVKYAEANSCDLVVVGAHSAGPIARMLMGSTSEYVLTHAACSVLIVPHHETP